MKNLKNINELTCNELEIIFRKFPKIQKYVKDDRIWCIRDDAYNIIIDKFKRYNVDYECGADIFEIKIKSMSSQVLCALVSLIYEDGECVFNAYFDNRLRNLVCRYIESINFITAEEFIKNVNELIKTLLENDSIMSSELDYNYLVEDFINCFDSIDVIAQELCGGAKYDNIYVDEDYNLIVVANYNVIKGVN